MDELKLYSEMLKIRLIEEKIVAEYDKDEMKTPMHLYIGQEAIAVGICRQLNKDDLVFSNHRGHGHYVAKGGNIKAMFAEFFCKKNGCSGAYGGSMHLANVENGLPGASAIVGGGIPLAVGAAFSFKFRKENKICVSFSGDGAADEGVSYESINFASLHRLPVLFVCENNELSIYSHGKRRQAVDIYKRFKNLIPSYKIDGNDVESVYNLAHRLKDMLREGKGPFFIECTTFRMKNHVGIEDNPAVSKEELKKWKEKCPIKLYRKKLMEKQILTEEIDKKIHDTLSKEIEHALQFGKNDVLPETHNMLEKV